MNCLLVYPEMPDTFYAMKHLARYAGKKAPFPPLGLMTVAAMLPKTWQLKLVDLNVEPLSNRDLAWADLVLLSAMNVQEESVRSILAQCQLAGVKIIAGGPLFTHEFERFAEVDHFVLNEAELTLPEFLEDLAKGEAKKMYTTTAFADVTQSPLPRYDLVNMDHYIYAIVQYSRGCPYLCDFCDVTALFGRKPRTKTPEQIIAELNLIRQHSRTNAILFADDNLIGNKRILKSELLPALIEWQKQAPFGFYLATQVTINLADDPELMRLMLDAGFRSLFIGIETPQEDSLKDSRKNQNLKRDLISTIKTLHGHGFIIYGGFILGFDTDTEASFENMRAFIQESGIPMPIVNILKAPPGTELFDRMKREGRLIKDFAFEEGDTNIRTVMPESELLQGFLEVLDGIYAPQNALLRMQKFLRDYRYSNSKVRIKSQMGWAEYRTAIRLLFKLFVLNPARKYAWKHFWHALRQHRPYLESSVFHGLLMYQMLCTSEQLKAHALHQLSQATPAAPNQLATA
jgi:radical SAM superfamily enzyme YgiQ (UPF0313 family)